MLVRLASNLFLSALQILFDVIYVKCSFLFVAAQYFCFDEISGDDPLLCNGRFMGMVS